MGEIANAAREREERERGSRRGRPLVIANGISVLRIPFAIAFVVAGTLSARLVITAMAAASDLLDGVVARRWAQVTRAGEILDPIVDRVFVVTALVALAVEGRFPLWALPLMLLRDIGVTVGALLLIGRDPRIRMPARRSGKRVTALQMVGTVVILLYPAAAPPIAVGLAVMGAVALRDYHEGMATRAGGGDRRPIVPAGSP